MRFFRVFFILFVCFFIFYFGVFLYFRNQFPSERISSLAQSWLSKRLGKPVEVEKGAFHLLKGFQLENIHVWQNFSKNKNLLEIKKVELRYVWQSLINRKLEISGILIEEPIFFLSNDDFPAAAKEPVPTKIADPIDWKISLKRVEIRDAAVQYFSNQEEIRWKISLEKLKLNLSNLQLEKIDFANWQQNLSYILQGQAKKGKLKFEMFSPGLFRLDSLAFAGLTFESLYDVTLSSEKHVDSLKLTSNVPDSINVAANLTLSQNHCSFYWHGGAEDLTRVNFPTLKVNLSGFTFSDVSKAAMSLELSLQNWFYALTNGEYENVTQPNVTLISDSISVGIDSIFQKLETYSFLNRFFESVPEISGHFYLDSLKIAGEKGKDFWKFAYQLRNRFENFRVDFKNGIQIKNLHGTVNHSGLFKNETFKQGGLFAKFSADSLLLLDQKKEVLINSPGIFEIKSALTQNFVPESLVVKTEVKNIFGGNFVGTLDLFIRDVFSLNELDLQHITGTGNVNITDMNLTRYAGSSVSGFGDLNIDIRSNYGYSSTIVAKLNTTDLSVEFDTTEGFELLPDVFLQINGDLSSAPGFAEIKFHNAEFTFNDLSDCKIDASYYSVPGELRIYLEDWFINLPVLQDYFPAYLRDEMIASIWEGGATVNCEIVTWQGADAKIYSQIIGDLSVSNEIFDNPYWYVRLDSLELYGVFAGSLNEFQLDLEGRMKEFKIIDTTPNYSNTQFFSYLSIENWNDIYIQSFSAVQPNLNMAMRAEGSIQNISKQPVYYLSGGAAIESDSAVEIILGTKMAGIVSTEFSIFSRKENPNILQLKGRIDLDSLDFVMDDGIQLYAIKGQLPVDQLYDLDSGYLIPVAQTQHQKLRSDLFEIYANYYVDQNTPYSILTADSLIYADYKAENIVMLFDYEQGSFFIPKISMNLYDGSLWMSSSVNLNSGAWNDISYQLQGQLSRVNSSILPGVMKRSKEESRIGISFFMRGKGLDLSKKIDLEGELNVTEIGSFATENLLNSIDPTKTDPSIRSVRRMIWLGYKPNSISFTIRHNNFYPSISFRQPWYSPVRIAGGEISISRLPVKFLLDLMAADIGSVKQ